MYIQHPGWDTELSSIVSFCFKKHKFLGYHVVLIGWWCNKPLRYKKTCDRWMARWQTTGHCIGYVPAPPSHHNHFTTLFPGPPGWAGARRGELMDFMVQGKINRGRHTNHPDGCHSIQTSNQYPPPSPIFFTGRMPFLPPNKQRQTTAYVPHGKTRAAVSG